MSHLSFDSSFSRNGLKFFCYLNFQQLRLLHDMIKFMHGMVLLMSGSSSIALLYAVCIAVPGYDTKEHF